MATKKSRTQESGGQDIYVSRSEKKRLAKNIEEIARELAELSPAELKKLPCDEPIRTEIKNCHGLKAGSLKRQIKFIAKELRQIDVQEILSFLTERKGSRLKQAGEFHELEQLREDIISEALYAREEALHTGGQLTEAWDSEAIAMAVARFPDADAQGLKKSALSYAATRKPVYRKEIFRQLQAAQERQLFADKTKKTAAS
ncbi:ribosome biogenesis factor YjgA [Thiovibrio sp. JS02]